MTIARVILLVLDSVGAGALPDAATYGDDGAGTLANVARHVQGLRLPNLERLGLGYVTSIEGIARVPAPQAACGRLQPRAASNDSTTGHWELTGLEIEQPFATFPDGFPADAIAEFEHQTGRRVLGNLAAAEEVVLDQFGNQHMETGDWIVFTSANSVFQVAAHKDVVSLDELYDSCRLARRIVDRLRIGRVSARPFKGSPEKTFEPTNRRRDFSMVPPRATVLDHLRALGLPVIGIGRIDEIFAGQGLSETVPSQGNTDGMIKTIEAMARIDQGLVLTNLNDFDTCGHRRDPASYAKCLEELDIQLAMLLSRASDEDLVLLTADHGNDPTRDGTDHTREYVPIIAAGPATAAGVDLGNWRTFADVAATIAEVFGATPPEAGESFLKEIS